MTKTRVTDSTLNVGLMLAMEFGENWLEPIQARLRLRFPALSEREVSRCNTMCRAAMNFGRNQFAKAVSEDSTAGPAAATAFARLVRSRSGRKLATMRGKTVGRAAPPPPSRYD